MIVNRHDHNATPPRMSIYLRKVDAESSSAAEPAATTQPASSRNNLSKAQPPTADERVVHVDMKDKHSTHILEFFLAETRAIPLQPSKEDIVEMQSVDALGKQAEVDRQRVAIRRTEQKREEDMLKRARAAGGLADQNAS